MGLQRVRNGSDWTRIKKKKKSHLKNRKTKKKTNDSHFYPVYILPQLRKIWKHYSRAFHEDMKENIEIWENKCERKSMSNYEERNKLVLLIILQKHNLGGKW